MEYYHEYDLHGSGYGKRSQRYTTWNAIHRDMALIYAVLSFILRLHPSETGRHSLPSRPLPRCLVLQKYSLIQSHRLCDISWFSFRFLFLWNMKYEIWNGLKFVQSPNKFERTQEANFQHRNEWKFHQDMAVIICINMIMPLWIRLTRAWLFVKKRKKKVESKLKFSICFRVAIKFKEKKKWGRSRSGRNEWWNDASVSFHKVFLPSSIFFSLTLSLFFAFCLPPAFLIRVVHPIFISWIFFFFFLFLLFIFFYFCLELSRQSLFALAKPAQNQMLGPEVQPSCNLQSSSSSTFYQLTSNLK